MSRETVAKKHASNEQRLFYLEQLNQTLLGLQSANQALLARRAFSAAEESRAIDIRVSENNSEWAKATAAQALYFAGEDAKFKPPTKEEVKAMKDLVQKLDGIIAANAKFSQIVKSVTQLVEAFRNTQSTT